MYQFVDYYSLLEIAPDASVQDIEAAFTKEAREWQPYMYYGVSDDLIMSYLVDARRVLLDEKLRASYDRQYRALADKGMLPNPIRKNDFSTSEFSLEKLLEKRAQGKIRYDILEHKKYRGASVATVGAEHEQRQSTYRPDIELSKINYTDLDNRVKLETLVYDAFVGLIKSPLFQLLAILFFIGYFYIR